LVDAVHMPPAFSQSACVLIFDMSDPDGLADGEVLLPPLLEPLEPELGMLLEPEPLLELPDVPDGVLPPLPLPVWAAANAGTRAMVPTRRANTKVRM
jgi:hypothetical protein